jgi:hypothetical protein
MASIMMISFIFILLVWYKISAGLCPLFFENQAVKVDQQKYHDKTQMTEV